MGQNSLAAHCACMLNLTEHSLLYFFNHRANALSPPANKFALSTSFQNQTVLPLRVLVPYCQQHGTTTP